MLMATSTSKVMLPIAIGYNIKDIKVECNNEPQSPSWLNRGWEENELEKQ